MRTFRYASFLLALTLSASELKTASGHVMQYYLSLPHGWTAGKKWPVVIVIESANRQFQQTADVFENAREEKPFIIAVPLVIGNGGSSYRRVPTYHYSDAAWNEIERAGGCRFDPEGIAAVVRDVHQLYGGKEKYFLTGWEAGGHTVWPMIFQHPEVLRAAALSGPNYAGRCLDETGFSTNPARANLPVRIFQGTADAPNPYIKAQSEEAKRAAETHGFRNVSQIPVPEKTHGPLAEEVLAFFAGVD
jgi:poly(3-hydroxybutyrate) depolymerase